MPGENNLHQIQTWLDKSKYTSKRPPSYLQSVQVRSMKQRWCSADRCDPVRTSLLPAPGFLAFSFLQATASLASMMWAMSMIVSASATKTDLRFCSLKPSSTAALACTIVAPKEFVPIWSVSCSRSAQMVRASRAHCCAPSNQYYRHQPYSHDLLVYLAVQMEKTQHRITRMILWWECQRCTQMKAANASQRCSKPARSAHRGSRDWYASNKETCRMP